MVTDTEDFLDAAGMQECSRDYLRSVIPDLIETIVKAGASPYDCKLLRALPNLLTANAYGIISFGEEGDVLARALEFGSSTRKLPQVGLLSNLAKHLEQLLTAEVAQIFA
jgi:hypothetical protein